MEETQSPHPVDRRDRLSELFDAEEARPAPRIELADKVPEGSGTAEAARVCAAETRSADSNGDNARPAQAAAKGAHKLASRSKWPSLSPARESAPAKPDSSGELPAETLSELWKRRSAGDQEAATRDEEGPDESLAPTDRLLRRAMKLESKLGAAGRRAPSAPSCEAGGRPRLRMLGEGESSTVDHRCYATDADAANDVEDQRSGSAQPAPRPPVPIAEAAALVRAEMPIDQAPPEIERFRLFRTEVIPRWLSRVPPREPVGAPCDMLTDDPS